MKSGGLKRTADCVLAAGGIALLLPVWAGAAAVCALSGEGVIYRQERIGRDGKPFFVCKFRTMRKEAPVLPREALAEPERYYIPGGAFLRSTGIDELPQLWNVLRGEMSLIGPRPLIAGEGGIHRMRQRAGVYVLRPGITGLSQLCGDPPPRMKTEIDRLYLENVSPAMDGAVVLGTVFLLVNRQKEKAKITAAKIAKFLRNF
ncbi:MAG: sugar transferase [Clostridia bacterium]|nr:sugar transferase [Clostridia bacterium]